MGRRPAAAVLLLRRRRIAAAANRGGQGEGRLLSHAPHRSRGLQAARRGVKDAGVCNVSPFSPAEPARVKSSASGLVRKRLILAQKRTDALARLQSI
jgi:hypothetical protein